MFAMYDNDGYDVASSAYYALFALQHRGQESCGIAVDKGGKISSYRDAGLVNEVFTGDRLKSLAGGKISIGHVCYGTAGKDARLNAQPLVINHMQGSTAIAHTGNLTNYAVLRRELELAGAIFHTTGDSEVIAYILTQERLKHATLEEAVCAAMKRLQGAYCVLLMTNGKLFALRDPQGFHPLCVGKIGNSFVVASESCALDSIGATFLRDIAPGEIAVIDEGGLRGNTENGGNKKTAACVFELIYFARPDSVVDGSAVHIARQRAGAFLALEHPVQADVVVGVPDSGLDAAMGYARQAGIPYGMGFIKNKYIGRTFIQPTQEDREDKVRIKLNPIAATVKGKRVVLIDDSIVRGTTCARIVKLLRAAGAIEVHMRSSAPKFLYPCYYGTDIDSQESLIAWNHTDEEMMEILGVDSLGFLSPENVAKLPDHTTLSFCSACFTGKYPTHTLNKSTKGDTL